MANTFKDISQFTLKSAATGTEEFQVSATEKVTAQQIANKVQLSQVIMSRFSALKFTGIEKIKDSNSLLGALAILYDLLGKGNIKMISNGSTEYGFVSMGDISGTTHGFGWLLSISEKAIYIKNDFTSPNPSTLNNIQWVNAIKTGEKVSLDDGIPIIEVGDFTMINEVWPAKQVPGSMCAFYTGSDVYSQPEATEVKYVGFIILDSDFSTNKQATVVAFAKTSGKQYIGRLEFESQEINWFTNINTPVTVTDFKSLPNSVKNAKDGEIIPIIAPASASNGPTGLTSTGPAYGYVQVAKTGSSKAYNYMIQLDGSGSPQLYSGFCHVAATTISWTQIGGSSAVEKLSTWLEQGTEVAPHINISLGEVQVPLNRALKESDILRIDFMRRSEASTFYMQGVAIVHVGAVDNSIQGYAAALDEQYVDYGTGEFAALAFNASTKLIGHNYFNLHMDTNGSVPQDDYYIMGVYNISGK